MRRTGEQREEDAGGRGVYAVCMRLPDVACACGRVRVLVLFGVLGRVLFSLLSRGWASVLRDCGRRAKCVVEEVGRYNAGRAGRGGGGRVGRRGKRADGGRIQEGRAGQGQGGRQGGQREREGDDQGTADGRDANSQHSPRLCSAAAPLLGRTVSPQRRAHLQCSILPR
ncbi:hypothetical protein CALVIDRAFT_197774 [Calocera viscosa TUFC12733]|uniref:Uncharacterized protein n=1 Tax=Calocera viscosa (strain TUFC12733) TaxID=1330018 RepID=A0A167KIK9_CALVF|nr:hypothetical protein CALVIDRAFT_197774 [Calocera viscosa TUFC12733]